MNLRRGRFQSGITIAPTHRSVYPSSVRRRTVFDDCSAELQIVVQSAAGLRVPGEKSG